MTVLGELHAQNAHDNMWGLLHAVNSIGMV